MKKIFWAGDSTVQTNDYTTYPQTGIGQVFPLFIKKEYQIVNCAKNGRSTKSFIDEGRLQEIDENISEGDFLFIQFAHNDEKREDLTRYTEPCSSYMDNLKLFIDVARKHNAKPVLITPLERRCFVNVTNLGIGEHSDYVTAMKHVAERYDVPLVDLYRMSRQELKRVGELKSRKWYMWLPMGEYDKYPEGLHDNTHLQYAGAIKFSEMIAHGLNQLGDIYQDIILEELHDL